MKDSFTLSGEMNGVKVKPVAIHVSCYMGHLK